MLMELSAIQTHSILSLFGKCFKMYDITLKFVFDTNFSYFISWGYTRHLVGFRDGVPITEEFYTKTRSGGENHDLGHALFPNWNQDSRDNFLRDKEARYRSLAAKQLKPVQGLENLCQWVEKKGLKRAAVTNAPRENAELMISLLDLTNFFEVVIVAGECERAKPFPDPYQKALKHFGISPHQAIVLEDSSTGLRAAAAAGIVAISVATRNPALSLLQAGAAFVMISDFNDIKLWNALEGQPTKL